MPGPIFSSDNLQQAIMNTSPAETQQAQHSQGAPSDGSGRMWPTYLAQAAGGALDGISTNRVLAQGGREANPMMSNNPLANAIGKAGSTAAFMFLVHKLAQSGHPDAAKVLGYLSAGGSAAAGLSNLTQLK